MVTFPKLALNPFAKNSQTRTRWVPEITSHHLPIFESLSKELDLVARARDEGVHNRPLKDDGEFDETQRAVVARIKEGANLLKQFLANQINGAVAKVQARMPKTLDSNLALASIQGEMAEVKVRLQDKLVSARLEERIARRHLNKFIRDHALDRDAHYADHWITPFSVVLLLLTVETGANAFLFSQANPNGYAGGFIQALLFGGINVFLGLCTGCFGVRMLWHARLPMRCLGAVLTFATMLAGIALALAVAHYRASLELNPDGDLFSVHRLGGPHEWFQISSIQSLILLILSLTVFLLSIMKGVGGRSGFVDHYWGYKAAHISFREPATAYEMLKAEFRNSLHAAILRARDSLRAAHAASEQSVQANLEIAGQAEERADEVAASIIEWGSMGNTLIARYREENQKIRTAPPPTYFAATLDTTDLGRDLASPAQVRALAIASEERHKANAVTLVEAELAIADALTREAELYLREIVAIEARAETRLKQLASDEHETATRSTTQGDGGENKTRNPNPELRFAAE